MKERPILFSGPMVAALLAGTKTQTRRIAKAFAGRDDLDAVLRRFPKQDGCRIGQPGDRLWVRESWAPNTGSAGGFLYRADHGGASSFNRVDLKTGVWTHATSRWWPSIHMPHTASRLTLEITGVRVERLQDINEADAAAEGVATWAPGALSPASLDADPSDQFRWLWESINGPGSWAADPWVWVIEFQRINNPEAAH